MRYYKKEELEELVTNFYTYWKNVYSDDTLPDITYDDLQNVALSSNTKKKKAVYFKDFNNNYKLNIGDYFDQKRNLVGANEKNTENDVRFPIVVLYTDNEGNPDMFTLSEYNTLINHKNDEDMKLIVLDKMTKPMDKTYLDTIAKEENITYNYDLYK